MLFALRGTTLASGIALALACAARQPGGTGVPEDTAALAVRLPDGVRPIRYTLHLDLDPAKERFRGDAAIEVELAAPTRTVWLHGRDLDVEACEIEAPGGARAPAAYEEVGPHGLAKLTLPRTFGPGRLTLRFAWSAPFGDEASAGLHRWRAGGDVYVLPQLSDTHAGRAFPAFADMRFKTPFDVSVTVPAALVAISNEAAVEELPLPGGRKRVRFETTRPLPTYPLFVGAGPFDVVERVLPANEIRTRALPVRGIAPRGRGRELAFALEVAGTLLEDLERWLALPFPYGKLDHVAAGDFPGAFEDAGAILYGAEQVLEPPDRRDEEKRGRMALVIAHELAHQWFGNLVTAPDLTDIWLNESFAEFIGRRAADRREPAWGLAADHVAKLERVMQIDGLAGARAIRRPVRSVEDASDQIDGFVFDKGMAVLETVERWMGEERFREGLRAYVRAHADGTGSVGDLTAALSRAAGREVGLVLLGFVERPGVPLVLARVACDGPAARLRLEQRTYRPRGSKAADGAWQIPVCARLELGAGIEDRCTLVPPGGAELELPGCPAWLLPDAGGTAYYRWALASPDQEKLRAHSGRLSALERLSVARNARAAQRAGALSYAEAMDTLAAFAGDPDAAVAAAGMEAIRDARDLLLDPADRPLAEAVARRLHRLEPAASGFVAPAGESAPARRRRIERVRFLAEVARDPEVRREAERRGVAYAGVPDARFRPEAVEPELAAAALRVALEERGTDLYDALLPRLEQAEGAERTNLVQALALADSPALAGRAGRLWQDPRLRPMERIFPALIDGDRGVMRRTYGQLRTELAAMAAAVPPWFVDLLPLAAREVCEAEELGRTRELLAGAVARHPTMRSSARRALEQAEVCVAERDAERGAARAWFERASGAGQP